MKAIQIHGYGSNDVLKINIGASQPTTKKGQVLVQVYAASINPVDWKLRAGYLKDWMPLQFPATMGGDVAGVVTQIGEGVIEYTIGDAIYGSAIVLNGGSGAFAQFAAVNVANSAPKPTSLSFEEAASLPLVGTSAVQALEDHIHLNVGQKILIHGGAGGIGTIAIQIAKAMGGYVATTVNSDDKDCVKSLGADVVIDYKTSSFETELSGYDAVFDTVGGEVTNTSFTVLKPGGVLVSMMDQPNVDLAKKYGVQAIGQNTLVDRNHLQRLAQLVEENKIKAQIDKIYSLDDIQAAFVQQENQHPRGKVVIRIK